MHSQRKNRTALEISSMQSTRGSEYLVFQGSPSTPCTQRISKQFQMQAAVKAMVISLGRRGFHPSSFHLQRSIRGRMKWVTSSAVVKVMTLTANVVPRLHFDSWSGNASVSQTPMAMKRPQPHVWQST